MMVAFAEHSPKGVDVANDPEFWDSVRKACRQDDTVIEQQTMKAPLSSVEDDAPRAPLVECDAADDADDADESESEYVEEMEALAIEEPKELPPVGSPSRSPKSPGKRQSRLEKLRGGPGPDYKWGGPDYKWENSPGSISSSSNSNTKSPSTSTKGRRGKLRRSHSYDATDTSKLTSCGDGKRLSWDRGSRPKPDFRWDRFVDLDSSNDRTGRNQGRCSHKGGESKVLDDISVKRTSSAKDKTTRPKRRPPRRTKSDITGYDMPGRVRFCFQSTVCVEVPRATKDMKSDLYYTKQEIKGFKAERREEKQERREERRGEKQKAAAETEKMEAEMVAATNAMSLGKSATAPTVKSC